MPKQVVAFVTVCLILAAGRTMRPAQPAVITAEFIYEHAPFPSAHASTIVETREGLLAAWFGGTDEGHPDVAIWTARHDGRGWSAPVEVANGRQADGSRHPAWNPVLFQPSRGPLLLFYKVGPSPSEWWGMLRTSIDDGRNWGAPRRLPDGILGPVRAKPIELADGSIVAGSSTEHAGWVAHIERTHDPLGRWEKSGPLNDSKEWDAIQPTILDHGSRRLQTLCRSRQGVITESWSNDEGRTWSRMAATTLPNPSAGIDTVRLTDGRFLLVYNPTRRGRHRLQIAVSRDGQTWQPGWTLEDQPGEYSYPAAIQTRDGRVHVTYTWRRQRIRHVVLDPARL